jgi:hypothetical protein
MTTVLLFILALVVAPLMVVWYFFIMIGLMLGITSLIDRAMEGRTSSPAEQDDEEGDF